MVKNFQNASDLLKIFKIFFNFFRNAAGGWENFGKMEGGPQGLLGLLGQLGRLGEVGVIGAIGVIGVIQNSKFKITCFTGNKKDTREKKKGL